MRRPNAWFVWAACAWLAALMLASADVRAQDTAAAQPISKPGEVEALVAPIALYPDSLLSQVLMAPTNPLEIVYAARWLKANPEVKGETAIKPIESQPCDASARSLLAFPQVLEPLNDVVRAKLCGGFGGVAWPIRDRDTGVMSFIVNHQAQVSEHDLGPDNSAHWAAIKSFDFGPGWIKVLP